MDRHGIFDGIYGGDVELYVYVICILIIVGDWFGASCCNFRCIFASLLILRLCYVLVDTVNCIKTEYKRM